MAPDAFTVSLDIDIIVGVGSEFSPIGFGHILNGSDKNKSFSFNDASDAFNRTFGFNVSAGVEVYFWFYTGDPANFTTTISTTSAEKPSSPNPAGLSE